MLTRSSLSRFVQRTSLSFTFLVLAGLPACSKVKSLVLGGSDGGSSSGGSFLGKLSGQFEGEVAMQITMKDASGSMPSEIVIGIKQPKYRVEVTQGAPKAVVGKPPEGAFLVDADQKKAWVLVPSTQMAMAIDLASMKPPTEASSPDQPAATRTIPAQLPAEPPVIEKTGTQDVVAGYTCELWNIKTKTSRAEVCVAEDITWIDLGSLGWSSPQLALAALASGANRFPLRAVLFDGAGTEVSRMQATRIEKKSLDSARFTVPPEYRVIDMQGMLGGFGGLGAGGLPGALPHPTKAPGSTRKK
jgi:hypothetical protein